jgi:hypothetical protein
MLQLFPTSPQMICYIRSPQVFSEHGSFALLDNITICDNMVMNFDGSCDYHNV